MGIDFRCGVVSSAADRATAAQVLKDAGHDVGRIADLLGVSESQVYRYLSEFPREQKPGRSTLEGLEELIASQTMDESKRFQADVARGLADKMDKVRMSDKAQTGSEMAQLSKELRAIVADIMGTSENDREWLAGLFTKVEHPENT